MIVVGLTLFIAACATAMAMGSATLFDLPHDPWLLALIFSATVAIYTLDRLRPTSEDADPQSWRLEAFSRHQATTLMLLAFGVLGAAVATVFLRLEILMALVPLGVISVAYTVPIGSLRVKDIPYAKTFVVAAVWTIVTAWLPVWGQGFELDRTLAMHLGSRFLFLVAITLPFDFRDRARDASAGLRTLPQRLGLRGTQALSGLSLMGFVGLHAVWDPHNMFAANAITGLMTAAVIAAMRDDRGDAYYSVWVDGTMLLQYALLLTLTN